MLPLPARLPPPTAIPPDYRVVHVGRFGSYPETFPVLPAGTVFRVGDSWVLLANAGWGWRADGETGEVVSVAAPVRHHREAEYRAVAPAPELWIRQSFIAGLPYGESAKAAVRRLCRRHGVRILADS